MKQFLLFAGERYYPSGGWQDFRGDFDSQWEAAAAAWKLPGGYDWWHIIDTKTGKTVAEHHG